MGCCDYAPYEWDVLASGMRERKQPLDDFVCACFQKEGFVCSLDMRGAYHNWPEEDYPPPTHWTGTVIDYSFARGLVLHGSYVVMTTLSDHLPVLTDWIVPGAATHIPNSSTGIASECRVCNGSGVLLHDSCPLCDGIGEFID